ncbi:Tox-REase-5 domain-containing protein [Burkholderia multivorans]|uniref:Tox-REase-5 domain-containing protein n=1 Tax=Burkholderia multivorans TaxID=87883 RepID=UPI0015E345D2|nr:Tox-REase-5 domain-containing protein [Burkholderia multivorans]MCA8264503.1 restriction endonuclease fold toxin 5 domain-containing protein [Burkholderia multivorans]MCL4625827.1 restriction endonuclease fold toxin 5 domain-containing protein [Burkholderia multivorans]MCO1361187.1 restriction endonuclease fold toxin 5 domain-containing protein [Burkholderia multivorans]MCO1381889.1 restriction endonuclease fold toxin 5 domain-containing protein [Burkholderia multivorans]MCO1387965.1 restri
MITGQPYSVEQGWSEESAWLGPDFGGFQQPTCLLQEAKGDYDRFFDSETKKPVTWFKEFSKITVAIEEEVSGIPCVRRVEIQTPMLNRSG